MHFLKFSVDANVNGVKSAMQIFESFLMDNKVNKDELKLRIAFEEILMNALEHAYPRGVVREQIDVRLGINRDLLRFSVRDYGVGYLRSNLNRDNAYYVLRGCGIDIVRNLSSDVNILDLTSSSSGTVVDVEFQLEGL